jgi:hypothetical protein
MLSREVRHLDPLKGVFEAMLARLGASAAGSAAG